jgi:hypothetical protein
MVPLRRVFFKEPSPKLCSEGTPFFWLVPNFWETLLWVANFSLSGSKLESPNSEIWDISSIFHLYKWLIPRIVCYSKFCLWSSSPPKRVPKDALKYAMSPHLQPQNIGCFDKFISLTLETRNLWCPQWLDPSSTSGLRYLAHAYRVSGRLSRWSRWGRWWVQRPERLAPVPGDAYVAVVLSGLGPVAQYPLQPLGWRRAALLSMNI